MTRALRILILVSQYPPDVNSTGMLMRALGKGLIARGHTVHIMSTFPHYAHFRIPEEYRGRLIQRTVEEGIRVTRVWVHASGQKQRMWHRLANYLSYNLNALLAAQASAEDYDVALATSTAFFTGITAWLLGILRGFPYVYNVQDIYPDVPVRAGQLRSGWQVRGLERIGLFMYRQAARVTVISEQQRRSLIDKGVAPDRIELIPNFVDVDHMRPLPRDEHFASRFGWNEKFIVMHSGNLGFAYDFDAIIEAAARMRERKDIRFVLIGDGVRRADLQQRAQELQLQNVQFLPFQPEADLPAVRACSDLQLSLYKRGSSQFSLPSKLYEIMASGRPVVASAEADSEVTRLVERAQAGVVIEPENTDALVHAVIELAADPARRARLALSGRAYAVAHHSVQAAVTAYESVLLGALGRR